MPGNFRSLTEWLRLTYLEEMNENASVRYAGFWIRFVAEVIDSLILTLAAWLLQLLVVGIYSWVRKLAGDGVEFPFSTPRGAFVLQLINAVIYTILAAVYYTIAHYRYGTTLGKKPLGIYVVNHENLEWISLKQSVVRTFGYILSYLPFLIGYLMAAFHPEKRALHDLIAGTVSIRRSQSLPVRKLGDEDIL